MEGEGGEGANMLYCILRIVHPYCVPWSMVYRLSSVIVYGNRGRRRRREPDRLKEIIPRDGQDTVVRAIWISPFLSLSTLF